MLQCGRIYKDAEIGDGRVCTSTKLDQLQCGRIYKDAEILQVCVCLFNIPLSFNVAASIKMRKSKQEPQKSGKADRLQCGRIYKDAEIKDKTEVVRVL